MFFIYSYPALYNFLHNKLIIARVKLLPHLDSGPGSTSYFLEFGVIAHLHWSRICMMNMMLLLKVCLVTNLGPCLEYSDMLKIEPKRK